VYIHIKTPVQYTSFETNSSRMDGRITLRKSLEKQNKEARTQISWIRRAITKVFYLRIRDAITDQYKSAHPPPRNSIKMDCTAC